MFPSKQLVTIGAEACTKKSAVGAAQVCSDWAPYHKQRQLHLEVAALLQPLLGA